MIGKLVRSGSGPSHPSTAGQVRPSKRAEQEQELAAGGSQPPRPPRRVVPRLQEPSSRQAPGAAASPATWPPPHVRTWVRLPPGSLLCKDVGSTPAEVTFRVLRTWGFDSHQGSLLCYSDVGSNPAGVRSWVRLPPGSLLCKDVGSSPAEVTLVLHVSCV